MTTAEQGTTTIDSLVAQIKALEAQMASPARKVRGNVPKRSRQSSDSGGVYGKAPVGISASETDRLRKSALEAEFGPNILARWREGHKSGLITYQSQGKVKGNLDKDLGRCDTAGVLVWGFGFLPGGERGKALDQAIEDVLGMKTDEFFKRMYKCGYAYHSNGHCFMCRCDGTPARGRRNYRDAAKYARPDDKG